MQRYIVSAQRSGLNWLRFCIETMYGVRTSGKTILIPKDAQPDSVFIRSHDALNFNGRADSRAWRQLDPEAMKDASVLLILRDPLETYVRAAGRKWSRFANFFGNIVFYDQCASKHKMVAYYDELVGSPAAMWATMDWLNLDAAAGHPLPTREQLEAKWAEMGRLSRAKYDTNQSGGGGAVTRDDPTDFTYHQKQLNDEERRIVWVKLQLALTPSQLDLIRRYAPAGGLPRPSLLDRIRYRAISPGLPVDPT